MKYDILTLLGCWGCRANKHDARIALRLLTLITARYNWQDDTLISGQREIARLWNVTERTVKRDLARYRNLGWLVLKRPAARGRVACYGLGTDVLLRQTSDYWSDVGPDFAARLTGPTDLPSDPKIVPFPIAAEGPWPEVAARLQAEDAGTFNAWFAPLLPVGVEDGILRLKAPSRFHASFIRTHHMGRLMAAARVSGLGVELSE